MTQKEKREARQALEPASALCASMPRMPVLGPHATWRHRPKLDDDYGLAGLACVARSVKPKEVKTNAQAQASLQKEWEALRKIGAWNESKVREWSNVREEAKLKNKRAHVGMVFGICVEKGSELPAGHPGRK